jgi:hypothetical protein
MPENQSKIAFGGACTGRQCYHPIMPHDPAHRPKRSRDPIKAAFEVFQEVIGEAPRKVPHTRPKRKAEPKSERRHRSEPDGGSDS